MSTQILDGITVEVEGEGSPVICLHGLGGSSNTWSPVLDALSGRQIIRIDLPGSARSTVPTAPLSIARYVDTVLSVMSALKVPKADIVAHSMGTIIAQHLATAHPEAVTSLALFGALLAPPEQGRPAIRARASLAREKGMVGLQEIADAIVKGATSEETKALRPVALALVRESVMRQSPEGYAKSCEALADAQPADIAQIRAPTLLVTGDEDGVGSPATNTLMREQIPGSRLTILSGCGHWTTFEKPRESVAELTAFYKAIH